MFTTARLANCCGRVYPHGGTPSPTAPNHMDKFVLIAFAQVLFYFDTEHLVSRLTDDPDVIGWAVQFNKIFCFAFLLVSCTPTSTAP